MSTPYGSIPIRPPIPWRSIALAYVAAMVPMLMIAATLDALGIGSARPPLESLVEIAVAVVGNLLFSPSVETWLMIPIFSGLRRVCSQRIFLVVSSALIWAVLHGIFDWPWAFPVFWAFLVYSFCFLRWEEERGRRQAFWLTTLLHALVNVWSTVWIVAAYFNR